MGFDGDLVERFKLVHGSCGRGHKPGNLSFSSPAMNYEPSTMNFSK